MIASEYYGQSTTNSSREEGRKEEQRQQNLLQQQAREDAGSSEGKRQRIIYIENAHTTIKPFVIEEVSTVEEVTQKICEKYPGICIQAIGFRISNTKSGSHMRKYFTDTIPYEYDTLYIVLYLRKHS